MTIIDMVVYAVIAVGTILLSYAVCHLTNLISDRKQLRGNS